MKVDLKELIAKLTNSQIYMATITYGITVASGKNGVNIPITNYVPSTATILSVSMIEQPNANWIHCGITTLTQTYIGVAWDNTYSGSIAGNFVFLITYRL